MIDSYPYARAVLSIGVWIYQFSTKPPIYFSLIGWNARQPWQQWFVGYMHKHAMHCLSLNVCHTGGMNLSVSIFIKQQNLIAKLLMGFIIKKDLIKLIKNLYNFFLLNKSIQQTKNQLNALIKHSYDWFVKSGIHEN